MDDGERANGGNGGSGGNGAGLTYRNAPAGIYQLERAVRCTGCRELVERLHVIRMYRVEANFMSSLPRSGRALVCPSCGAVLAGELGAFL